MDQLGSVFDAGYPTWIDIPIGLPTKTSFRECDRLARRTLPKGYASSVFNPPTRAALHAASYREASEANAEACGKKLSKQAWFLVPRIRAADSLLHGNPSLHDRVFEAHPELTFAALCGEALPKKHTGDGLKARLDVLQGLHPATTETFEKIVGTLRRYEAGQDDVLDAMILAWGAWRMSQGKPWHSLPSTPPPDGAGAPQRIVYAVPDI